jgi:hypothetical protein
VAAAVENDLLYGVNTPTREETGNAAAPAAIELLAQRYARGEIDDDEYFQRRACSTPPTQRVTRLIGLDRQVVPAPGSAPSLGPCRFQFPLSCRKCRTDEPRTATCDAYPAMNGATFYLIAPGQRGSAVLGRSGRAVYRCSEPRRRPGCRCQRLDGRCLLLESPPRPRSASARAQRSG